MSKERQLQVDRKGVISLMDQLGKIEVGALMITENPQFKNQLSTDFRIWARKVQSQAKLEQDILKIKYPHTFDETKDEGDKQR